MKNERCLIKKIIRNFIIILIFIFNTGFYYNTNINYELNEIEIELGNPIPTNYEDYISSITELNDIIIENNVPQDEHGNTIKSGSYNFYLVYNDTDKKFSQTIDTGTINVIDTIEPEIMITDKKLTFNYGTKIDINKIAKCVDLSECTLTTENKIDNTKVGTQEINIIATDESGNTREKTIKITINRKKKKNVNYSSFNKMNEKNNNLNASLSNEEKNNLRYQIIEYAKRWVGNPYVYGGTSLTKGTDCSGFTMKVYAHFGYSLPRVAISQAYVGKRVSYSELLPGDLVVYHYENGGGHVGIYIGNGKMVHAGTSKTGIEITKIFKGNKTYQRIIY